MASVVTICIGNSDDKLTQKEWSSYIAEVSGLITKWNLPIFFHGYALPHAIWQNACWVIDISGKVADLPVINVIRQELSDIAEKYRQDSIALTLGDTEFVKPKE